MRGVQPLCLVGVCAGDLGAEGVEAAVQVGLFGAGHAPLAVLSFQAHEGAEVRPQARGLPVAEGAVAQGGVEARFDLGLPLANAFPAVLAIRIGLTVLALVRNAGREGLEPAVQVGLLRIGHSALLILAFEPDDRLEVGAKLGGVPDAQGAIAQGGVDPGVDLGLALGETLPAVRAILSRVGQAGAQGVEATVKIGLFSIAQPAPAVLDPKPGDGLKL